MVYGFGYWDDVLRVLSVFFWGVRVSVLFLDRVVRGEGIKGRVIFSGGRMRFRVWLEML